MSKLPNISYMYENEYKKQMAKLILDDYENKSSVSMRIFSDCYILPSKFVLNEKNPVWGQGGVETKGEILPESIIPGVFGGKYEFDKTVCKNITEPVIHIPILKDHWGHFLIDVLCRFWFLTLPEYQNYPITCCANLKTGTLEGNFLRVFELLGILDRLHIVTTPVHCEQVLIPDFSLGFDRCFSFQYLNFVHVLVNRINIDKKYCGKKIYFTRTKFLKSKIYEIGEKRIEKLFKRLGFEILAPELLSIEEQISCFQTADEIVSLSGTIPHNIVFARAGLKYTILNRQPIINLPQLRINQLMKNVSVTYIDVWHPAMARKPQPYGTGAVWVLISKKLEEYIYATYKAKVNRPNPFFLVLDYCHWILINWFDSLWRRR